MALEQFIINYPETKAGKSQWARTYGLNAYYSGKSWRERREDAEFWHSLVHIEMTRQRVRKIPFDKPVIISMYFCDNLDCSNHAMYFKMIEDALKGRLIVDDGPKWVRGCEMYLHEENYIKIIVKEVV